MRVPSKVVAKVGREFVNRSLRTSDYREAIRQARIVASEFQQSFDAIRADNEWSGHHFSVHVPAPSTSIHQVELQRQHQTVAAPLKPKLTLKLVYERYIGDPAAERSAKTMLAYNSTFNRLAELVGEDTPIESITRDVCRDVLDTLRFMPSNATKRYGKLSAREAAERAKAEGRRPMSATTVNGYLNKLSALFNWAENEGYIFKNPARGLRVVDPVRKKDKRQPFTNEQLTRIFNAPLYKGCVDDEAGYAHPGKCKPRRGRFWVPLIGLFSGMRLNEICQLEIADVKKIDEVECFVITRETGSGAIDKKLKTENAERFVPVHPTLIEIGILQYVNSRRASGRGKLFSDLSVASTGYYSDNFSKWFANFLEKAGAKAPRTSFHSFRHNFRDALREAKVRKDIAYALGGWANENSDCDDTAENYGRGFSVNILREAIAKVDYQGCSFRHLSLDPS
ncbi:hypothetical protein CH337_07555 [Rhodoblastus acidophilus]|nr:hypothetical protein CKO16_16750 [Rhodoblastus acidophilus]RAI21522.1 hypothetical protein CH337_07555 [Rhodoblastus acidophilus]